MQLHPQVGYVLEAMAAAGYADLSALDLAELRAAARTPYVAEGPPVRSRALSIPGPAQPIALRVYEPPQSPGLNSGLVFFAAGGYAVGELAGHVALCQQLAMSAGCVVVSVETRLAPEHKFPAAIDDAYLATCWIHENADELGIDHRRLAIGGESTGATIATAVCRLAKERRNPALTFQLLLYPVTDVRPAALQQMAAGAAVGVLTPTLLSRAIELYVVHESDRDDPRCSPLAARNLFGLPPALIVSAEHDLLHAQIEAYASALRAAHVPVQLSSYTGVTHGFVHMFALLDRGREALVECSAALRTAFGEVSDGPVS
jgi:acetyl esterase